MIVNIITDFLMNRTFLNTLVFLNISPVIHKHNTSAYPSLPDRKSLTKKEMQPSRLTATQARPVCKSFQIEEIRLGPFVKLFVEIYFLIMYIKLLSHILPSI